jgi:hypothetical protein
MDHSSFEVVVLTLTIAAVSGLLVGLWLSFT